MHVCSIILQRSQQQQQCLALGRVSAVAASTHQQYPIESGGINSAALTNQYHESESEQIRITIAVMVDIGSRSVTVPRRPNQ